MAPDFLLLGGIAIFLISLPGVVSSATSRQSPTWALSICLLGFIFMGTAYAIKPGGYAWSEIPDVVTRVTGTIF